MDSIEITFARPSIEPMFEAVIYRSKNAEGEEVYRVMIGGYGKEAQYQGELLEIVDFSGLTTRDIAETWAGQKVKGLENDGKQVEFDENIDYLMARVVDEFAPDKLPIPAQARR
jgi:hypothetical protein